jgi:hypothetical protein
MMDVHSDRHLDVVEASHFVVAPPTKVRVFVDIFGNLCRRFDAPAGCLTLRSVGFVQDSGRPDPSAHHLDASPVSTLPAHALHYLLGSRYCETDLLSAWAWSTFGHISGGGAKVQAVCDFVHEHLTFSYPTARPSRTAKEALEERLGVCRDFTHLAITLTLARRRRPGSTLSPWPAAIAKRGLPLDGWRPSPPLYFLRRWMPCWAGMSANATSIDRLAGVWLPFHRPNCCRGLERRLRCLRDERIGRPSGECRLSRLAQ